MDDAIRLLKTQQMKGLPFEPEPPINENKFVYASAEIVLESARRDRRQDSLLAEKTAFESSRKARAAVMAEWISELGQSKLPAASKCPMPSMPSSMDLIR